MHTQMIDTRFGTANQYSFSHGNCLPYTGVPFGMNYFAPQTTDQKGSWWFHPEDRTFQGYRLTHQPSPWMGDYSRLLLTPVSGTLSEMTLGAAQSSYRPEEATFEPTQLVITQLRYQATSRLIPTMYGAALEVNYRQQDNGLLLQLPGRYELTITDETHAEGWVINFSGCEDPDFKMYFTLSFDAPITNAPATLTGEDGLIRFDFGTVKKVITKLGTSFIDQATAQANLANDVAGTPAELLTASRQQWQNYLGRINVTTHNPTHRETFYHNLYRCFLFPQTFYETNAAGEIVHYDTVSRSSKPGVLYTNNGFWDTFRTVYPLYSLIAQDKFGEMLEGFLNSYEDAGFLPKWLSPDERGLMPGTLIDGVIADAAAKGIRLDLMPRFLEAMKKSATIQSDNPNYGRRGTTDYLKYGYVPLDHHESVNHTLDYAYSDYCISKVAEVVGDEETAAYYRKQSLNYRNIFDPETGFMRAKDKNGAFRPDFSPIRWGLDYAEGSAWQSSFSVFQDFRGLVNAHGGKTQFEAKLAELFNMEPIFDTAGYGMEIHEISEMAAIEFGQFAISNQPSFHYPYLSSYIGKPEMTQPLIKQTLQECFSTSFNGYPGDEDNGTTAAWYIFNSLGFYPVTSGSGEYVIGMPLVESATLHLSNGNTLAIDCGHNQPQQLFIHEVSRNDHKHTAMFFTHEDLLAGGEIAFHLGLVPAPREYRDEDYPFSLTK